MSLRRSLVLAFDDFSPVVPLAQAAEDAGYERVWTTDSAGRDAVLRAVVVGGATSTIEVATGIAYAFTRDPLALASAARDAQQACGGRFTLGLGAGTRGLRRRHGVTWEHPAPRFADLVSALRTLIGGGGQHKGRFYDVDAAGLAPGVHVPVAGSGVNRIMVQTCARSCDGVALHALAAAPRYLEEVVVPALRAGAGSRPSTPQVTCWVVVAADPDEERARAMARRQLAFYLSTPGYRAVAETSGWGGLAEQMRRRARETAYADWDSVASLIPDDVLDRVAVAGTEGQVRVGLERTERRLADAGIDEMALQIAGIGSQAAEILENGKALVRAGARR